MWIIYLCFSIVVGDIVAFNLKWGENGVLTDFVSPLMLNFWSTFFKYSFCVKLILTLFWSHTIFIPSTFFALPRFFISNSEDKSFSLSITDLLLEAIIILSTYNSTHMCYNGFVCNSCLLWSYQNAYITAIVIALIHKAISSTYTSYYPFLQSRTSSTEIYRSPLQDRHGERRSSCRADQAPTHIVPLVPTKFK